LITSLRFAGFGALIVGRHRGEIASASPFGGAPRVPVIPSDRDRKPGRPALL